MFHAAHYDRVWHVVIVSLTIVLTAVVVLWAGQSAGDQPTERRFELVVSPWDGIFRVAPQGEQEPYVEVGSDVTPDTVVGLIELDIMRPERRIEVIAGVRGRVVEVLVGDGTYVHAGQPVIVVLLELPNTLSSR